jgi:hypothetical protein
MKISGLGHQAIQVEVKICSHGCNCSEHTIHWP